MIRVIIRTGQNWEVYKNKILSNEMWNVTSSFQRKIVSTNKTFWKYFQAENEDAFKLNCNRSMPFFLVPSFSIYKILTSTVIAFDWYAYQLFRLPENILEQTISLKHFATACYSKFMWFYTFVNTFSYP